ncbi:MAG: 16S rRNA methyltransferase [Chloroflexi bacterium]|nr:16S rRNA methyltransferase [Chloroflexota bacterium]
MDEPSAPQIVQRLSAGVPLALAMLAGMVLDVFTPLRDGPLTAGQIAEGIGVAEARLAPLLYALVSAGLLAMEGELFANSPEAARYLVRGGPSYMGGVHELWAELWAAELKTADSIRRGVPQAKHDYAHMSSEELASFVRGSHAGAVSAARLLLDRSDWGSVGVVWDVGGGSGGLATTLVQAYPHLRAEVLELPAVAPITQRLVDEAGLNGRVSVQPVDVARQRLTGSCDVAVLNRFLQVLAPSEALCALINVAAAVRPGGEVYIIGHVLDDSRCAPPAAVAFNLLALNLYDGGQAYTEKQHRDWLAAVGFTDITRSLLPNGYSLITARRQA